MSWLSIETSSPQVSLALGEGTRCLHEEAQMGNASTLVEPLCRRLKPDFPQLNHCVIGQGPGSYNGLRVGYAFLKGLLAGGTLPVIEISSTLTLAAEASARLGLDRSTILVLNNARRGELYGALVEVADGLPRILWEMVAPEPTLMERLPPRLEASVSSEELPFPLTRLAGPKLLLFPTAARAGGLARRLNLKAIQNLATLEPHYVRPPVVPPAPRTNAPKR